MRACDYSIFQIRYKTTYPERKQPEPGEDFELTGKMITEERTYLCVAPSQAFAVIAFNQYHINDKLISTENLGQLNDLVFLQ